MLSTSLKSDGLNGKAQKIKVCQFQVPKKWPGPPHEAPGHPGHPGPHPGPPGVPHPPPGKPEEPPKEPKKPKKDPKKEPKKDPKKGKGDKPEFPHPPKDGDLQRRSFLTSITDFISSGFDVMKKKAKKPEVKTITALNCYARVLSTKKTDNGVLHEVSNVLLPPASPSVMLHHFPHVVGVLNAALEKADLEKVLDESKSITLFAPSNWAFKKLGAKAAAFLFSPKGKDALVKILSYHVVPEVVYSKDALKGVKVPTLVKDQKLALDQGKLEFHGHKKTTVVINKSAKVMFADSFLANGVSHLITEVLIPKKSGLEKEDAWIDDEFLALSEQEAIAMLPEEIQWVFEESDEDMDEDDKEFDESEEDEDVDEDETAVSDEIDEDDESLDADKDDKKDDENKDKNKDKKKDNKKSKKPVHTPCKHGHWWHHHHSDEHHGRWNHGNHGHHGNDEHHGHHDEWKHHDHKSWKHHHGDWQQQE